MTLSRPQLCRGVATFLLLTLLLPMAAPMANAQLFGHRQTNPPANSPQRKPGMSMGKKVMLLTGAALLYYLWRKHQQNAARQAANGQMANGQMANNRQQPQLYRSKNGGIYYRDAQGNPVWLTVPSQGMQVPAEDVQRYAPDYRRYRGPAPSTPQGYRTQPFSALDNQVGTM